MARRLFPEHGFGGQGLAVQDLVLEKFTNGRRFDIGVFQAAVRVGQDQEAGQAFRGLVMGHGHAEHGCGIDKEQVVFVDQGGAAGIGQQGEGEEVQEAVRRDPQGFYVVDQSVFDHRLDQNPVQV